MPNLTCPVEHALPDPVPFLSEDGSLNFKLHYVGWIVSGFFTLIATVLSFWLIWQHLSYYTHPLQQRNIVRLLFMVPVYALASWMSYLWYRQAIYFQTVRDCYEAIVIVSFFTLILQYVGDTPEQQQAVFRTVKLKKWFWPLGRWRYRPKTGLDFLWIMKVCVLQYAVCLPVCTATTLVLQSLGLYCENSWMPWFGHLWISLIYNISVTIAMYCLIVFYLSIADLVKPYNALLKLFALKAVVFLCFWQGELIAVLVATGAIRPSAYTTSDELQAEIAGLVVTVEMTCFALLHFKAFPYSDYRPADSEKSIRWRAILDAADYRDLVTHMRESSRFVYRKARGKSTTHVDDIRAEKLRHLKLALGRGRVGTRRELGERGAGVGPEESEEDFNWTEKDGDNDNKDPFLAHLRHLETAVDNEDADVTGDRLATLRGRHNSIGGRRYDLHDITEESYLTESADNPGDNSWWKSMRAASRASQAFRGYSLPSQQHEADSLEYVQPVHYQSAEPYSTVTIPYTSGSHLQQEASRQQATGFSLQSPLDEVIASTRHSSMLPQARPMASKEAWRPSEVRGTTRIEHQDPSDLQRSRQASQSTFVDSEVHHHTARVAGTCEPLDGCAVSFQPDTHSSAPATLSDPPSNGAAMLHPLDAQGEALQASDTRGKRIRLTLPAPLSPARYPLSTRRQVEARGSAEPENQSQTSTLGPAYRLRGQTMYDPWSGEPVRREQ